MSYSHDDLRYRQYGQAPPTQGTSPVGTVYANGTVQGPGDSMYGHSPTQGSNWPMQGLNALGPEVMSGTAGPSFASPMPQNQGPPVMSGVAGPGIAPPMPQNQLMQPTNQLMPPIWQEEWQKIYDQMAAIGHHDPQTVAYEEIGKYGLGPYAERGIRPGYGGGVSGGGG
jgi:hypothetical protein